MEDERTYESIRQGPSHPLALAALAALALNDHVGKAAYPGLLTGKLSDAAWLVVAPVALAAILSRLGARPEAAKGGGLGASAAAFVLLQLWAAPGDLWTAWTGGRHVADWGDLFALPALALVPLCWRGRRRRVPLALPAAALACAATSRAPCDDVRRPGDGRHWDANRPLQIGLAYDGSPFYDTDGVHEAVRLEDADGAEVPLIFAAFGNSILVCPVGGLEVAATYTWTIRPFESASANHAPPPRFSATGTTTFSTRGETLGTPAFNEADCVRLAELWDESGADVRTICAQDAETGGVD